jgi:DNA-binding LacI/PurR family transcriptional regulator
LELGHRRIGFLAGEAFAMPTREKLRGRADALREVGLDPAEDVVHASFTVEGGRRALRALVEASAVPPTAVMCSNDLMAIGVLQEAAAIGLRVPDDLSVVGFDGIDAAAWTQPPLTTIEQPIADIARSAVAALRQLIEHPRQAVPSYVFRPSLRRGGTTAPAPDGVDPARPAATSKKSSNGS